MTAPDKSWASGVKLVLLGTMAGPVFDPARAMTGQIVFVDGVGHMIDCGLGALWRMNEMRIPLSAIRSLMITHHHSDHVADYPAFLNMSWIVGLREKVAIRGPAPLAKMHEHALRFFDEDAAIRVAATGRKPMGESFDAAQIERAGLAYADASVKITCARVDHPPFQTALAYRIDAPGRSIAISGDTTPVDAMADLAKGADVLVHEAMYRPAIRQMLDKRPYVPPFLYDFLVGGHTDVEDAGRIAERAGVRTLVLSHLLPGDMNLPDEIWTAQARKHFGGEIIVGRDRMIL
ncbi:MAG: fold metallo-hydrolase [Hyphomicrobiales bacterium]|nr:fold metallo-hydrolase [Hyphomicrobiales bacterium]